jgi:adenosylhomocysteine nucleosidase
MMRKEVPVRILLICPVPIEFTSCRSLLSLRDSGAVGGCRCARGSAAGLEIVAVQSGPGKARAAAAAAAAIPAVAPDLVVDTGTCGALDAGLVVGAVIVGRSCIEYDIAGTGLPRRIIPEMRLPSAMALLPRSQADSLVRTTIEIGRGTDVHVREGAQACGEFFIQSPAVRDPLAALTGALAANWETAGVFVAALRAGVPPVSFRAVSDLGDERSLQDFRRNTRGVSRELYRFVRTLAESGWFMQLHERWRDAGITPARAAREVLP